MEQSINQGDIVLVPFPFTDLSAQKKRPAVVISPNWFNNNYEDVILSAMTSLIPENTIEEEKIIVHISFNDISMGSIPEISIIKLTKIFTCSKDLIIKNVATICNVKISEALNKLIDFFSEKERDQKQVGI